MPSLVSFIFKVHYSKMFSQGMMCGIMNLLTSSLQPGMMSEKRFAFLTRMITFDEKLTREDRWKYNKLMKPFSLTGGKSE